MKSLNASIDLLGEEIRELEKAQRRLKILKAQQDFLMQFKDCVRAIGGTTDHLSLDITLDTMTKVLAQNGLTFTTREIENDM